MGSSRNSEGSQRVFKCSECGVRLPLQAYRAHVKQVHEMKTCGFCDRLFTKEDWKSHRKYCLKKKLAKVEMAKESPVNEPVPDLINYVTNGSSFTQGKMDPYWKTKLAHNEARERRRAYQEAEDLNRRKKK